MSLSVTIKLHRSDLVLRMWCLVLANFYKFNRVYILMTMLLFILSDLSLSCLTFSIGLWAKISIENLPIYSSFLTSLQMYHFFLWAFDVIPAVEIYKLWRCSRLVVIACVWDQSFCHLLVQGCWSFKHSTVLNNMSWNNHNKESFERAYSSYLAISSQFSDW